MKTCIQYALIVMLSPWINYCQVLGQGNGWERGLWWIGSPVGWKEDVSYATKDQPYKILCYENDFYRRKEKMVEYLELFSCCKTQLIRQMGKVKQLFIHYEDYYIAKLKFKIMFCSINPFPDWDLICNYLGLKWLPS